MADVFISYGRTDDEPFVLRLRRDLQANGVEVWWDLASMESRGRSFLQEIRDAIASCDRLLLIVGPQAMESDYVESEWRTAMEYCRVITPVLRLGDHALLPAELAKLHCPDLRAERSYAEGLEELIRILRSPIPPLGTLYGVDELPAHFIPRVAELAQLRAAVDADLLQPTVIVAAAKTTVLQGMGGVGKTVLAAAFARACETRRSFGDGVIWLRVGREPETLNGLSFVGQCLGEDLGHPYPDLRSATARLSQLFAEKYCLLVLDDVWRLDDIVPFTNVLGPRCRLLLTTRDVGMVSGLGAQQIAVQLLSNEDSLELLARWAGVARRSLPTIADDLVQECGRLPLALAMVGSLARVHVDGSPARLDVNRWERVLRRLRHADLEKISRAFPNYPYPNLLRAIEVSVEALGAAPAQRYLELAIFVERSPVPEETLALYWSSEELTRDDVGDVCDLFGERSLARRTSDGRLTLHTLQFDYVRLRAENQVMLHRRLVEAYRARSGGVWAAGADDGYYFGMLPYHLREAGLVEERERLLLQPSWMEAKLRATTPPELLADYRDDPGSAPISAVRHALDLSIPALVRSPSQLRSQLLGRLLDETSPAVQAIAESLAHDSSHAWLRPVYTCLISIGGTLVANLPGHVGRINALRISNDGRFAVTGSGDRTVRFWDLESHACTQTAVGHANSVNAVLISKDGRRIASGSGEQRPFHMHKQLAPVLAVTAQAHRESVDNSVRVWDRKTGEQVLAPLTGHSAAVRCLEALPDGRCIASGSDDGTVRIWDIETGEALGIVGTHDSPIVGVHWLPDARKLMVLAETDFAIYNLGAAGRLGTGQFDATWQNILTFDPRRIILILQDESFDGYLYKLQSRGILGSTDDKEAIADLHNFDVPLSCAALSGDGDMLLIGSSNGGLTLFDMNARSKLLELEKHASEASSVALSINGDFALTGSEAGVLWHHRTSPTASVRRRTRHLSDVNSIVVTRDCRQAVSGSHDGAVMVWDLTSGEMIRVLTNHDAPVRSVVLTSDHSVAVTASADGVICACHIADATEVFRIKPEFNPEEELRSAMITGDGARLVVLYTRSIGICDLTGSTEEMMLETVEDNEDDDQTAGALLADGRTFVVADASGQLICWDVSAGTRVGQYDSGVTSAMPGDATFIYEAIRGPWISRVRGEPRGIVELTATPGNTLFTGSLAGTIDVWDTATRSHTASLDAHPAAVLGIRATPDGKRLASVSEDGLLRVWATDPVRPIAEFAFDEAASSVGIGCDGRTLAVGSGGGPGGVYCLVLQGLPDQAPMC